MSTSLSTLFGEDLGEDLMNAFHDFDREFSQDLFGFPGNVSRMLYGKHAQRLMKTDVTQTDDSYQVAVDLPGFRKEDIQVELNDGCLTISALKTLEEDDRGKDGTVLRRERYSGTMRRSFYVGDHLTETDIRASYENGVLRLTIPRRDVSAAPRKHIVCIEG